MEEDRRIVHFVLEHSKAFKVAQVDLAEQLEFVDWTLQNKLAKGSDVSRALVLVLLGEDLLAGLLVAVVVPSES